MQTLRPRVGVLALVAAAALVPLAVAGAFSPGRTISWRDNSMLYGPLRPLVTDALRRGRLPLWNPYEGTGQPLFAQAMHAVLHPTSLLLAPFTTSMDAWIVLLVALAAVGTFLASRGLEASPSAAVAAAGGYAASGYVLAMASNVTYLCGAATLPWVVEAMRAATAPVRARWLLASAAVAAMAFSGVFYELALGVLVGGILAAEAGGLAGLGRAVLGATLGLALAAVQLVPTLAVTTRAARSVAMGGAETQWALDPWRLVELVSPGFFMGIPESYVAPVYQALGWRPPTSVPWASSIFVGAPVLLLAIQGARTGRLGKLLAGLSLFVLWLALGHHLGAQQALSWVPLWSSLRYAEKLVAPLTLCLALAAARGVDAASSGSNRRLALAAIASAAIAAAIAIAAWAAPASVAGFFERRGADALAAGLATRHLGVGAVHAAATLAALAAAVRVARRSRPLLLGPALAALLWATGWAAAPYALHSSSSAALASVPPLRAEPPGPRLLTPLDHPVATTSGLDAIDRTQLLMSRSGVPSTNVLSRVDNAEGYTGLMTTRMAVVLGAGPNLYTLLRRYAATHLSTTPPHNAAEEDVVQRATVGATRVVGPDADGLGFWEVPHRPWASFAPSARPVRSFNAAAVALQAQARRGGSDVIVETDAAIATAPGRVLSLRRDAEEVEVEAESDGEGLLIVNDAWDPGWAAELDGRPVPILPADVLVRAVRWPAGRHRLRMAYDPPEVALGAALSAAGVAVALLVVLRARSRAAPPAPGGGAEA
jgi:hypothetical protein